MRRRAVTRFVPTLSCSVLSAPWLFRGANNVLVNYVGESDLRNTHLRECAVCEVLISL
jgi:hypothetical protein